MTFRPLHDRVAVRRLDGDATSRGGIIIPDTVKEKPQEGEVVAVGPGARDARSERIPLDVRVCDVVLFGKWSGADVRIDHVDLLIMGEGDLIAVLDTVRFAQAA